MFAALAFWPSRRRASWIRASKARAQPQTAYLDDILIYSKTLEEHRQHVRAVLERLQKAGLYLKPEKCEFHETQVEYLGLIVSTEGIKMDLGKLSAVLDWEEPRNVKDVQSFLGFANFYRRFINNYSRIVGPLTDLTHKNTPVTALP